MTAFLFVPPHDTWRHANWYEKGGPHGLLTRDVCENLDPVGSSRDTETTSSFEAFTSLAVTIFSKREFVISQVHLNIMAEEPQPPNVQEGVDPPDVLPANAEDRKAARALSSLDQKPDEDAAPKKEIDLKALNNAMKTLGVSQEQKTSGTNMTAAKKEAPKKMIKVDQSDVALLVRFRIYRVEIFQDILIIYDAGRTVRHIKNQGYRFTKIARRRCCESYDSLGHSCINLRLLSRLVS